MDVEQFWKAQYFDLKLLSFEGNGDLCFLKSLPARLRVMQRNPKAAEWWSEQEELMGMPFLPASQSRKGEPTYRELNVAARQVPLKADEWAKLSRAEALALVTDHSRDCVCHD
ncbi:MAG TPA: hypothetical protein VI299_02835 [Polyangiales bacterium]